MVKVGVIGLGKMGLSHFSIIRAHAGVEVVGVCDSTNYVLDIIGKYTGVTTYADYQEMLEKARPDAVLISTPSKFHAPMVRDCLDRGIDVFCEKPFCLDPEDSRTLAALAQEKGLVTQVGYHNRHVGAFAEAKRLLEAGGIGRVTHVLAEAYGPVVLKPKGGTWRSKKEEGGGALYDYAAHPIDLLSWYFGRPDSVSGTVLGHVFSEATEDEVFTTLRWPSGVSGQLSVSWSDESQRKMTTRVTVWGTHGRLFVDRQEIQVYRRDGAPAVDGYGTGWNVRYTTELTDEVDFYVRGEEYSAQLDEFVRRVKDRRTTGSADFAEAAISDEIMYAIANSGDGAVTRIGETKTPEKSLGRFAAWRARRRAARAERKAA